VPNALQINTQANSVLAVRLVFKRANGLIGIAGWSPGTMIRDTGARIEGRKSFRAPL
jgi:hypothetical protein